MSRQLKGSVSLPGSKSESNRALMIAAYGGFPLEAENLSDAHDTVLLQTLLRKAGDDPKTDAIVIDCEDAGTVARFMVTFLACKPGTWILTGTPRLRQRPVAHLVEALQNLGADIEYMKEEGTLPVRIDGTKIQGGSVAIDASQSSQFVTSLLLAAPTWDEGLRLTMTAEAVSEPYIDMTLAMMACFGVKAVRNGETIMVAHQPYCPCRFTVSADWSAASYWYEMAALSDGCDLLLEGLKPESLQGDAIVAELFRAFGVRSVFEPCGVRLTKVEGDLPKEPFVFDFARTPDLFPAVFVTCIALHQPAVFRGIQTLSLKESNRVESLISELLKLYDFKYLFNKNEIIIEKSSLLNILKNNHKVIFNTYGDHRVAMALAPLSLKVGAVSFDHPEVVTKSYPTFWRDLSLFV